MMIQSLLSGMTAGVGAVIVSVVYDMGRGIIKSKDWIFILIMFVSFVANYVFNINVVYIILIVAVIGAIRTIYRIHGKAKKI